MKSTFLRIELSIRVIQNFLAIVCAVMLLPGDTTMLAESGPAESSSGEEQGARIPPEQLDSLVAPIALYPDPMLTQTLVASTYPLEIIQLQLWLAKNKNLKDKALADAAAPMNSTHSRSVVPLLKHNTNTLQTFTTNSGINQYAQRIISTPGKHDGLYWKNNDGTPGGTISEAIAHAIDEGYSPDKTTGYHGYYFKVLKGQGPAAPFGQLDYVIDGAMIGGFALMAFLAEYRVTGVKSS